MTLAEQVYEVVKQLPDEKVTEVLTFANSIKTQEDISDDEKMANWHRFLDSLDAAVWADFPTLEEIRANQGEDVPRESW